MMFGIKELTRKVTDLSFQLQQAELRISRLEATLVDDILSLYPQEIRGQLYGDAEGLVRAGYRRDDVEHSAQARYGCWMHRDKRLIRLGDFYLAIKSGLKSAQEGQSPDAGPSDHET